MQTPPQPTPLTTTLQSTGCYISRLAATLTLAGTAIIFAGCNGGQPIGKPLTPLRSRLATGPLRVNPANPRYFMDGDGKTIYLTGSHTWTNLQDRGRSDPPPIFDYKRYLDFLVDHNHNFFRLWSWEQTKWSPARDFDFWYAPMAYERPGPGKALDGKPKFDLTKFNQAYFDRLRDRVIQAGQRGIYVSIMLFDGWSIDDKNIKKKGNPWRGHPFNRENNINGINGDSNRDGLGKEIHTLQIPAITRLQEAYVRKVIDTVDDLDNVLFEISNESPRGSETWQYHMIHYVKSYEAHKTKQHPVGMTVEYPDGNNNDLFASPADWISPNEVGGYRTDPPPATSNKVVLLDTDHLWGIGGNRQWVWKSFMRGYNPIFMDPYDATTAPLEDEPRYEHWESLRRNMGYTLTYANRVDLKAMKPRGDLATTGYCLANTSTGRAEYLVYLPRGGTVTVDLSATTAKLHLEWFLPGRGRLTKTQTINGGRRRLFFSPYTGDVVLYIWQ